MALAICLPSILHASATCRDAAPAAGRLVRARARLLPRPPFVRAQRRGDALRRSRTVREQVDRSASRARRSPRSVRRAQTSWTARVARRLALAAQKRAVTRP